MQYDNYIYNKTTTKRQTLEFQVPIIKSLIVFLASFTPRLVADRGSDLTLDVLFLPVDNQQQRRVHSDTPEVKHLAERGFESKSIKQNEYFILTTSLKHLPCLCGLYFVA